MQAVDGLARIGTRHIAQHDAGRELAVDGNVRGHLVGLELRGPQVRCLVVLTLHRLLIGLRLLGVVRGGRGDLLAGHVCETPDAHWVAVHRARDAFARVFHDIAHHRVVLDWIGQFAGGSARIAVAYARALRHTVQALHRLFARFGDAFGQHVHGVAFDNAGHEQNLVFGEARRGVLCLLHTHHARLFDGQCTGLVKEDVRDAPQILEHVLRFDEDARFGEAASAGHVRDRRRDQQWARGGEHQHLRESQGRAGDRPRDAGDEERDDGERHREHVCRAHHGRTRILRGLHEFEDLLVLRVLGERCGADHHRRRAVDSTGEHLRAGEHRAWHRLAVDVAQVKRGRAGQQRAIDRHDLARQHEQHGTELHLVHRHGGEVAVARAERLAGALRIVDRLLHRAESFGIGGSAGAGHAGQCDDVRLLRRGFDECGQVAARLGLRVGLDGVARRHHERDGPSRPILLHRHGGGERHDRE